jgi:hypothetical protein
MRLWQLQAVEVVLLLALFLRTAWSHRALLRSISSGFVALCDDNPTGEVLERRREFGL